MTYNYSSTAGEYSLTGAITSSATTLNLDSVTGLPSVPFKVVIDPGDTTEEIVKVTNVAGLTLTVVRGWDSSAAVAHAGLAKVRHMLTAEDLRLSRQHEAATTGVHGTTGTIVDTDTAQALTNKDLTSGTNSFPTSLVTLTGTQTLSNKTFSNTIDVPTGSVQIGTGTSATQYTIRLQRQRTDAGAGDLRFELLDAGDAVAYLRKDATILNTFSLKQDGSTTTSGALSVGGDLTAASGGIYAGSTTSTSQYHFRVRRLGSDAVSRDARLYVEGDNSLTLALYYSNTLRGTLKLTDDGNVVTSGNLTTQALTATTGTFSGAVSTGALTATSATVNGRPVPRIHHGSVNVTLSSATIATVAVSLSGLGFTSPKVVAQVADWDTGLSWVFAKADNPTSTGFDINALAVNGTPVSGTVRVDYIVTEA